VLEKSAFFAWKEAVCQADRLKMRKWLQTCHGDSGEETAINPDPKKNDPAVSRQDWTLHGFATQ